MRGLALLLMLAGCVPDFGLDALHFQSENVPEDAETFEDASPEDTGTIAKDAGIDANEDEDSGAPRDADPTDAGPLDADPIDAEPIDAEPMDAEPIDAEPMDADPTDADPIDADPMDADPVDVMPPDAGDCTIDCSQPGCDGFVYDNGVIRWQCRDGVKAEADCNNGLDDDGNGGFDCHDTRDCGCLLGLLCCNNGRCLQLGQLCGD